MKRIQIVMVEVKNIGKVKELIKMFDDTLTEWAFNDKTYSVFDPGMDEIRDVQMWTCIGEDEDFTNFAISYAAIIDPELQRVNLDEHSKKIL